MQYILSKEEYDSLIPKQEYIDIRNHLIDDIERLNKKVLELCGPKCTLTSTNDFFCDNCPIGMFGTKTCTRNQQYSK